MTTQKAPLGFWINAYCFLTLMGGFYLAVSAGFNLATIRAENASAAAAVLSFNALPSLALLVFALLSIYLVYRLIARRNRLTLNLVRGYQLIDLAVSVLLVVQSFNADSLSFFALFELLTNLAWLIFFFRSERVLLSYVGPEAIIKAVRPKAVPSVFLLLYCVGLLITAWVFYVVALSPDLIAMDSLSGQVVFLFLALFDLFVLYRLFNVFNTQTLNCLRIRGVIGVLYAFTLVFFEPSPSLFYLHSGLIFVTMVFALYFFASLSLNQIYSDKSVKTKELNISFGIFLYTAQTLVGGTAALLLVFADQWLYDDMRMTSSIKGLYVLIALFSFYGVYRLFYRLNRLTLNYIRIFQLALIAVSVYLAHYFETGTEEGAFTRFLDYAMLLAFAAYFFFSKRMRTRYH
ncbi:MAG: hypothetical protein Q4G44_01540 [Alcaligenaceae bacterium]|nr:hypothetical protein [Alcaligenaceae bacterium]